MTLGAGMCPSVWRLTYYLRRSFVTSIFGGVGTIPNVLLERQGTRRTVTWAFLIGQHEGRQAKTVNRRVHLRKNPLPASCHLDSRSRSLSMYGVMSAEERKIVDEIEARWKQQYDSFRNHPAMSEGQQHDMAVFRAIDGVHKALSARENAPFRGSGSVWKRMSRRRLDTSEKRSTSSEDLWDAR